MSDHLRNAFRWFVEGHWTEITITGAEGPGRMVIAPRGAWHFCLVNNDGDRSTGNRAQPDCAPDW